MLLTIYAAAILFLDSDSYFPFLFSLFPTAALDCAVLSQLRFDLFTLDNSVLFSVTLLTCIIYGLTHKNTLLNNVDVDYVVSLTSVVS